MLSRSIAPLALAAFAACAAGSGPALAETSQRLSGPHVHQNLAVYFIHGESAAGAVPLTLDEALAMGKVQVLETGQVNELKIENTGGEEVFIQAGDIVKGGRQDRVLMVSLLLPPHSGALPISSFCVEAGRWSGRAGEDDKRFTSAAEAMPSRQALLAMAAPKSSADPAPVEGINRKSRNVDGAASTQQQVWDSVAKTQDSLAVNIGAPVRAEQSATSLQLSLENAKLKEARASFVAAIDQAGRKDGDVVGFVAAINGTPVSANVYPSNGLFRKVWAKQLAAVVTEAIGQKAGAATASAAPSAVEVQAFLAAAERGKAEARATTAGMSQETRDGDKALYSEARAPGGRWLHKGYLAK
jgi:hypothetical protein